MNYPNPTPQALKAAEALVYAYKVGPFVERVAASIDHDTKLPELLAVVKAARNIVQTPWWHRDDASDAVKSLRYALRQALEALPSPQTQAALPEPPSKGQDA